jgi:hypothetical protein
MPRIVKDAEEFVKLASNASACRVKRSANDVKLKLRTKHLLYTYITDATTADALLKKINIPVEDM